MVEQPSGTVTLVFTDIEGSTRLLQELGQEAYRETLAEHRRILRDAFARHSGYEVDYEGDAFFYAFSSAGDAVSAVCEAQVGLAPGPIRVRVGVHTGEPGLDPPKYVGMDVHLGARLMAVGHGGQVLLSKATRELVDVEATDLGEHRLKDIGEVWLYQLGDGEFPPLKSLNYTNLPTPASSFLEIQPGEPEPAPLARDAEHEAVCGFLDSIAQGPRTLLVTGEAGIGKTTVWEAGLAEARRRTFHVLSFRADASERGLSFAALGGLLEGVLAGVLPQLPSPQRRALEAALALTEMGAAPEPRLVGLAVLNVLRALAAERPLLVAVDDLQWLDLPSGQLLAFALRRLQDEPVGLLANLRAAPGAAAPFEIERGLAERLERLEITPLSLGALQQLLRKRLAVPLPRSLLRRIHDHSGGNPFYALELARALAERGEERLPESLRALVADRIERLPDDTRSLLVALAAAAHPTLELVRALDAEDALEPAERDGVLVVEDARLRFSHPLLAAAAQDAATSGERRAAHRRLAELVDDPEQRARHLALAAEGPDEQVASALVAAAAAALARGAPASAAELAERAVALTPPEQRQALHRRRIEAARRSRTLGNTRLQRVLLDQALAAASTDRERAEPLWQLASMAGDEGDGATARALITRALEYAAGDDRLCAAIYLDAVWLEGGFGGAAEPARAALIHAERSGDAALEAAALSAVAYASFSHGLGFRRDLFERAVELERTAGFIDAARRPTTRYGMTAKWAGDLALSRDLLEQAAARAREDEDASGTVVLYYLTWLHLMAGEWQRALERADESQQIAIDSARDGDAAAALLTRAIVEAHLGRLDEARSHLDETRALAHDATGSLGDAYAALWAWGAALVASSSGQPRIAVDQLEPVIAELRERGLEEPGYHPWFPTYGDALVQVGRVDEAEALTAWLEERAIQLDRRWALAMCAHLRGTIAAARGGTNTAIEALGRALELHEGVGRPFDRAWTLLVYGQLLGRARGRRPAREVLGEALGEFERLGATLWAEKARAELARIGRHVQVQTA